MINKRKKILAAMAFLFFSSAFYIRAEKIDPVSAINTIFTGHVQIELKEYELKNGKEMPVAALRNVLPGEEISLIPKIYNKGENCWIRTKVIWDTGEASDLVPEIKNMDRTWKKINDFYYYQEPLEKKEEVRFFQNILIPEEYQNEAMEQLSMKIQVDAIQQANFEPDFSSADPWSGQEIEECIVHAEITEKCPKLKKELLVEYNGAAKELLLVPKDFFINFETMMPGDQWKDTIQIQNDSEDSIELYFSSELYEEIEDSAWMEKLILRMWSNEKKLYEGSLVSEELKNGFLLDQYLPSNKGNVTFELELPKELKNEYALKEGKVKWSFYTKYVEDSSLEPEQSEDTSLEDPEQEETTSSESVKTGDDTVWTGWILLMIGAGVGIIWIVRRKRRQ